MDSKPMDTGISSTHDTLTIRGDILFEEGKYLEATELYTKAINLCPQDSEEERKSKSIIFNKRSLAHSHLGDDYVEKCVRDCSWSIMLDPKFMEPYLRRADTINYNNFDAKFEQALRDYQKVVEIDDSKRKEIASKIMELKNKMNKPEEPPTKPIDQRECHEEVQFEQLIKVCREKLGNDNAVQRLMNLQKKFKDSVFWGHTMFQSRVKNFYNFLVEESKIESGESDVKDFAWEFENIGNFFITLNGMPKKVWDQKIKMFRKLVHQIKINQKKIEQLDKAEISLEDLDNEDSPHIMKEKYERALARDSRKLLELQGAKDIPLRCLDRNFKYDKTEYPALNRAISNRYRLSMQNKVPGVRNRPLHSTPNYHDILEVVQKTKETDSLPIVDVEALARQITDEITKEIQRRREREFEEMIDDYTCYEEIHPESYADEEDEDFQKSMEENAKRGQERISKLMQDLQKRSMESETDVHSESTSESSVEEEEEESIDLSDLSDLEENVDHELLNHDDAYIEDKENTSMGFSKHSCDEENELSIAQAGEKRPNQENMSENYNFKKPKPNAECQESPVKRNSVPNAGSSAITWNDDDIQCLD